MPGYIPGFDVVRYDVQGFMVRVTSGTVTLYNETTSTSIGTRSISSDGIVAMGSITGTVGDVVRVSHATYPNTIQFTLTATQDEAFTTTDNAALTYVAQDLRTVTTPTDAATAFLIDKDNPTLKPQRLGVFKANATTLFPVSQAAVAKNYRIKWVSRDRNFLDTGFNLGTAPYSDVTVPAISVGGTGDVAGAASSTDNAIARFNGTTGKVIQNSAVTVDDTTGIMSGSQGFNLGGSTSGAVNLRVPAVAGSNTLTFPAGTTDFSATGGSKRFVRQDSAGAALTVDSIHGADLTLNLKTVYLEQYGHTNSGLAAAITAVGSTRSLLVITEDITISSSQTIPATCVVRCDNGAKFLMTNNSTLTINSFRNPGNVQCFGNVDATHHVVFGAGAVERYNLAWYMGIGSTADCSYAIADIITSVNTSGGGTMFVPAGSWKVNNITAPDYFEVVGASHGNDTSGTRFIPKDSGTTYLWRAYRNFRNISFRNVVFAIGSNTGTEGLRIEGSNGYSGFGIVCNNCTFHGTGTSSQPLLNTSTDQVYEIQRAAFRNCQFIGLDNSKCVYINTVNSQFGFLDCSFIAGKGDSYGVDAFNAGITIINCDFRGQAGTGYVDNGATITTLTCSITSGTATLIAISGTFTQQMVGQRVYHATGLPSNRYIIKVNSPTSATLSGNASATLSIQTVTIYKWTTDNTNRSGCAIRLGSGAVLTANIQTCVDEGFNYSLKVIGGSYDTPITLIDNVMQGRISIQAACVIYGHGNDIYSCAWDDTSGIDARIYSKDNYSLQTVEGVTLSKAKMWGPNHAGGSAFVEEGGYRSGHIQQRYGYPVQFLDVYGSDPTRPLVDILTTYNPTGGTGQALFRLGIADAATDGDFLYGHYYRRNPDTGYGEWKATQDAPYTGWSLDFPLGYDSTSRGTVTQGTSRTTGVTLNKIHGLITCFSYASTVLQAGEMIEFTLTNSWIQNSDYVLAQVVNGATTDTTAHAVNWGGGVCKIRVRNNSLTTDENTSALKILFTVVQKNGGQGGIAY